MRNILKYKVFIVFGILFIASPVFAGDRWTIDRDGDEIELKPKYGNDLSKCYKGEIESEGSVRLYNSYTGVTLSGYIDADGTGFVKAPDGNRLLIPPQ